MKSRAESISETDKSVLIPVVDGLIADWCDRRALGPLRLILRSYPLSSGLSDDWHELYKSLRDLENLRDSISTDERERITYARRVVEFIIAGR